MSSQRFIVDTNILLSSIAFQGSLPDQVLKKILTDGVLVFSQETLDEFKDVILRPKFDRYIRRELRQNFFFEIATSALLVEPKPCKVICRDPKDQKFLEIHHEAEQIISGDKDLLVVEQVGNCRIMSIADVLSG